MKKPLNYRRKDKAFYLNDSAYFDRKGVNFVFLIDSLRFVNHEDAESPYLCGTLNI
jgi:hypothetical protein